MKTEVKNTKNILAGCAFVFVAFCLMLPAPASAAAVNDEMAVKVILGEAADQGFEGMVAVAEVIRNRGSLKGFSSMRRDLDKFAANQPSKAIAMAERAWHVSQFTNYSGGATHFDNVNRFGMPRWANSMILTAIIKDMHYFRER